MSIQFITDDDFNNFDEYFELEKEDSADPLKCECGNNIIFRNDCEKFCSDCGMVSAFLTNSTTYSKSVATNTSSISVSGKNSYLHNRISKIVGAHQENTKKNKIIEIYDKKIPYSNLLSPSIKNDAVEFYMKYLSTRCIKRGDNIDARAAACLKTISIRNHIYITNKELAKQFNISQKKLTNALEEIRDLYTQRIHDIDIDIDPLEYQINFVFARLKLDDIFKQFIKDFIAITMEKRILFDVNNTSKIPAILYLLSNMKSIDINPKDIELACSTRKNTFNSGYKKIMDRIMYFKPLFDKYNLNFDVNITNPENPNEVLSFKNNEPVITIL
jgi:hypothetical protein